MTPQPGDDPMPAPTLLTRRLPPITPGVVLGQRASDRRPGWLDALECEANAMMVAPGAVAPDRRAR